MNTITRLSDWCEIDQLNGNNLEDGEKLIIEWPTGKLEQVTIKISKSSYVVSDMGHPCEIPVRKAHVTRAVNGVDVLVPILGLKAQRVE